MKVIATEKGERPNVLTKARRIAPEAAKFIAKQLEDKFFADSAIIIVDWDGDLGWSGTGPMPEDLKLPIMLVIVEKWYPKLNKRLQVDYKLDLEEMFGQDNAKVDDLFEIIEGLEARVRQVDQENR